MARIDKIDTGDQKGRGFPWLKGLAILGAVWASIWLASVAGGYVGVYIYDVRYSPERPYSDEQLTSMERVQSDVAAVARRDLALWQDSDEVGRSIARLEGALAGGILLLALWGTGGVLWIWGRERERAVGRKFEFDSA